MNEQNLFLWVCWFRRSTLFWAQNLANFDPPLKKFHDQNDTVLHIFRNRYHSLSARLYWRRVLWWWQQSRKLQLWWGGFLWFLQVYRLLAHISALNSWFIDNHRCCLDPIICYCFCIFKVSCSKFLSAQILFGPDQNVLDLTKMFWTWPKQIGPVQ